MCVCVCLTRHERNIRCATESQTFNTLSKPCESRTRTFSNPNDTCELRSIRTHNFRTHTFQHLQETCTSLNHIFKHICEKGWGSHNHAKRKWWTYTRNAHTLKGYLKERMNITLLSTTQTAHKKSTYDKRMNNTEPPNTRPFRTVAGAWWRVHNI
jgi:hypothetical protein